MTRYGLKPALAIAIISFGVFYAPAQAESLFRATANYRDSAPYTPPSLFTTPIPKNVGDMVTIIVDEQSQLLSDAQLTINRSQEINSNGSGLFNSMVRFFADKLPFGSTIQKVVEAPSFNGLNSANDFGSRAQSLRNTRLREIVSCQVVQVLPNGFLLVQGKKVNAINRDQQEIYVSGIVNPYYLDQNNQIASTRVGNFQLLQGGKGVISRTQSDGIANKIYQFFQ
ncbi:MAG: flagellar basal body L-ring protein FlgH [Vampirovibrionales bacterium]|nr:flagellar basal body L-ring protein FlgH [Vampirovibrionales bacterium]